jgi:polyhydroxyalkanoate synthesis regulator phasin
MTQPRRRSTTGSRRSTRSTSARSGTKRSTARKSTARKKSASARKPAARSRASSRADKSVQQFRDSLERSVTLSRDRLQEVVDDSVKRGRMTRDDANELVSKLVSRSRKYTDDLVRDLDKMLTQARKDFESRTAPARRQVERAGKRAGRAARDAADQPLAQADRLRRRAGASGAWPISAYEQLTAPQVKKRLSDLNKADLRKVRTREKNGKGRKGILDDIERRLAK